MGSAYTKAMSAGTQRLRVTCETVPYLVPRGEHKEKGTESWLKEIPHQFKMSQCERNKERETGREEGRGSGKKQNYIL